MKTISYVSEYSAPDYTTFINNNNILIEYNLPTLTAEGYEFLGWYYDEAYTQKAAVGDTVSGGDMSLYAKWKEIITVNSKMTALADEIRVLSGTEEAMGLDAMKNHIGEANDNVDTEADLIAQISAALEGKAGSGGSGVETCTLNYTAQPASCYCVTYMDGKLEPMMGQYNNSSYRYTLVTENLVCNSIITITHSESHEVTVSGAEYSHRNALGNYCYKVTAAAGEEVNFTIEYVP